MLALFWSAQGRSQTSTNRAKSKGPRAIAVLEFDSNQHVHLIPVTIMLNGEFYDAGAYKAAPIPMALEPQTVYEGVRTGVSQGLFTITLAHEVLGGWVGEGNWISNDAKPPTAKKAAPAASEDDTDKPPVLRRPGASQPNPPAAPIPAPAPPAAPANDATQGITVGGKAESKPSAPAEPSDRPILRRGKPEKTDSDLDLKADTAWTVVSTISAVSDAKAETSRSYHYAMNPDLEKNVREKVQALATKELRERVGATSEVPPGKTTKPRKAISGTQFTFQDVKFRAYDPSTTNEPIFVYEADTPMMEKLSGKPLPNHILLVVREDIYGEMHVLFSSISDPLHMDSRPRCDFVDVVDAEGDGYGELLFARTYDSGRRAFSVDRVIGNQLWPLFEGKP